MSNEIGKRRWVIAEGYIPADDEQDRRFVSHEAVCMLNASEDAANVNLTLFFADRDPVGPYRVTVGGRRTMHLRLNDLEDPQRVPRETDYSMLIESDRPIVAQHTRLDTRRGFALLTTIAYGE